jgi:actin-related protein
MTVNADIYSSKKIGLPTPHFVVLYNGINEKPDEFVYRLSDAYEVKEEDYDLDLRVRVVNVNKGHNTALMEKCKTLQEYSQFVDILRKYSKDFPSEQATHMAIDDCIEHDILRDYLLKNRAEVIAMVLYEFDIEKYKQQQEDKITLLQDTVQKQQLTLQQKDEVLQQKDEEITTLKKRLAQYEPQKV